MRILPYDENELAFVVVPISKGFGEAGALRLTVGRMVLQKRSLCLEPLQSEILNKKWKASRNVNLRMRTCSPRADKEAATGGASDSNDSSSSSKLLRDSEDSAGDRARRGFK